MIDIRSHILPELDDGSSSVSESLLMLGEMRRQGIKIVAATRILRVTARLLTAFSNAALNPLRRFPMPSRRSRRK